MEQKLRVWWIPQVPGQSFNVPVDNLKEAHLLLETLAEYDKFQFEQNVKPDYSNAGGLNMWDENADGEGNPGWIDWNGEDGEDFDEYRENHFGSVVFEIE